MFLSTLRPRGKPALRAQRRRHSPPPLTVDALEPRRFFAATLLADINPGAPSSATSYLQPAPPVQAGGRLVFRALDTAGHALWATDGTTSGTTRLTGWTDINNNGVLGLAALDGIAYAFNGRPTDEIWRSDGTPEGTWLVRDGLNADAASFTPMHGALYFAGGFQAADAYSNELMKTDGTAAGTVKVKDIRPGVFGSQPTDLTNVNGTLFFTAKVVRGLTSYNEIWKSDGTAAGTVPLKGFTAAQQVKVQHLTAVGDTLYFTVLFPNAPSYELWKSDGTDAGTVMVKEDVPLNRFDFSQAPLVSMGGKVWFVQHGPVQLWSSDGTPQGTTGVPGLPQIMSGLTAVGDRLYFAARDPERGTELWVSDGTAAGTLPVADVNPGNPSSTPVVVGSAGGTVYFTADDGVHGRELWQTDGTPDGTALVEDVNPGTAGSDPGDVTTLGGKVVFWADDGTHGREPWVTETPRRPAMVVGRYLAYRNSATNPPAGGVAGVPGGIAPDKTALLPGQRATFANVSNYSRGINAVAIDVWDLSAGPTAADFEALMSNGADTARWAVAPAPNVSVVRGGGVGGSDRVTLTWPDGTIRNRWLRVTMKPTAATGLAAPDVFYFGSLPGDTGVGGNRAGLRVDALDLAAVRRGFSADASDPAGPAARLDFNRDGRVDATDYNIARLNLSASLAQSFAAPATAAAPLSAQAIRGAPATRLLAEPTTRRGRYDLPA